MFEELRKKIELLPNNNKKDDNLVNELNNGNQCLKKTSVASVFILFDIKWTNCEEIFIKNAKCILLCVQINVRISFILTPVGSFI